MIDLNYSANIIWVIQKRRMRWAGVAARLRGEEKCIQRFGWEIWGWDHLEDRGEDGMILLRWIYRKWHGGAWSGLIWLRVGTGGGPL